MRAWFERVVQQIKEFVRRLRDKIATLTSSVASVVKKRFSQIKLPTARSKKPPEFPSADLSESPTQSQRFPNRFAEKVKTFFASLWQSVRSGGWRKSVGAIEPVMRQWVDAGRQKVKDVVDSSKHFVASVKGQTPQQVLSGAIQNTGRLLRKRNTAFYGYAASLVLGTYFLSDLTALMVDALIPEPRPMRFSESRDTGDQLSAADYEIIMARNLFNSRGLIPGEDGGNWGNAPAVRTSLPIDLIGTVVLEDEMRSLGTLADKTAQKVFPVRVGDEIPGKLRATKIEGRRVTFINLQNRRPEYVELPEDVNAPVFSTVVTPGKKTGIEQLSNTRFVVGRKEIDDSLKDLHKILTEARAIPHFENGVPSGFRLTQIVAGSIYEKLGLKDDDILSGINGENITNDPAKAWNYLSDLKTAKQIELSVKRNGKEMTLSYDIQ